MTGNRAFNDLHACTVVVARAEQQADEHHDRAANRNAGVLVRQKMLEQMTDFMEDDAHERTQSGADHAERHQLTMSSTSVFSGTPESVNAVVPPPSCSAT